jgi:hypothetical protein
MAVSEADGQTALELPPSPSFRSDDVLPDAYLGNLLVFFVVLAGLGVAAVRLLKDRPWMPWFKGGGNGGSVSFKKHSEKLSPKLRIHFLEYGAHEIVVAESNTNVAVKVLAAATGQCCCTSSPEEKV